MQDTVGVSLGGEPPPNFELRREDLEGTAVIIVVGEIDIATVGALREHLARVPVGMQLVVDLCETEFMDSSGLAALLDERAQRGDDLRLVWSPAGAVARLVATAQVPVQAYDSRTDAIAAAQVRR